MNPEPPSEEALFQAALNLAKPERRAFLDQACGGRPTLRARVEALLAAHDQPDTALADDPDGTGATVKIEQPGPPDEAPGQTLGRYRLLEKIGEGGFGVVYVAEQKEPVRRRVALKVVKLGMDTREVIARFEAERQVLALMDHPNIAKVLDGGATEAGRPYFVMELVRGIPITKYCDEHHLSPTLRLELFAKVCQAIQHAHQKGIIHRDIKPSNILVVEQDGAPVPKVIDFGIAKATQGDLTEKTIYTQFQHFIGTPAYMSPEQAGGLSHDIDTRSDIYSLGVLLYELLTGRTPFDARTLLKAGLEEMRRIIRDVEPPAPSTRLSTLVGEELQAVAQARHVDPRRLGLLVRGDLDWIVMKALEKDRARRYATASALADDIRRFLGHEPVSAVAPSLAYKLSKFVRRNRLAVAVAVTAVTLLVTGVVVTSWLAVVAQRARNVAAREARKSDQVARFLKEMLEAVRPAKALGRDTVMLRGLLDATAERISRDLTGQPEVEFELRLTIGRTYEALGALEPAERSQRTALALAQRLYGPAHTNTARVLEDLGFTLGRNSRFAEATNLLNEALGIYRARAGEDDPATAGPLHRLGNYYSIAGQDAVAAPLLSRALDLRRRRLPADHRDTLATALDLASLHYRQGRLDLMEPLLTNALESLRRTAGAEDPTTLNAQNLLAILRQAQGRFDEAEQLHTQRLEVERRILGPNHPFTLISMDNLAVIFGLRGRYAEAEQLCRRALQAYEPQVGPEHRNRLAMQSNLAEYLRNQGRYAEAETLFKQVMEIQRRTMAAADPFRQETQTGLAVQYHLQGRYLEAETLLQELLASRRADLPADDPALAEVLARLTLVMLAQDRPAGAEPLARECWGIYNARLDRDWRWFAAQSQLGACELGLQRYGAAEPLLTEGFAGLKQWESRIPAIERARVREAAERLVRLGQALNQPARTAAAQRELEEFNAREAALREAVQPGRGNP